MSYTGSLSVLGGILIGADKPSDWSHQTTWNVRWLKMEAFICSRLYHSVLSVPQSLRTAALEILPSSKYERQTKCQGKYIILRSFICGDFNCGAKNFTLAQVYSQKAHGKLWHVTFCSIKIE